MKRKGENKKDEERLRCIGCFQHLSKRDAFCRNCGNRVNKIVFNNQRYSAPITLESGQDEAESRIIISPKQFTSDIPSKYILPFNLSEPLYMINSFPTTLKEPKDHHAGNVIVSYVTEKTAYYLGRTPDQIVGFPVMRQKLASIDMSHYENYGVKLCNMMKDKNSYIFIRANNYYKNQKGKICELRYEGSVLPGNGVTPTTLFIFFKSVSELSEEQEKEVGLTLLPTLELSNN